MRRAIKILGYLKKYMKRGYTIDPKPPKENIKYEDVLPDFGNQYDDFKEEFDDQVPTPKMKELPITRFAD